MNLSDWVYFIVWRYDELNHRNRPQIYITFDKNNNNFCYIIRTILAWSDNLLILS